MVRSCFNCFRCKGFLTDRHTMTDRHIIDPTAQHNSHHGTTTHFSCSFCMCSLLSIKAHASMHTTRAKSTAAVRTTDSSILPTTKKQCTARASDKLLESAAQTQNRLRDPKPPAEPQEACQHTFCHHQLLNKLPTASNCCATSGCCSNCSVPDPATVEQANDCCHSCCCTLRKSVLRWRP